jgi:hypothetical protein
MRAEYWKLTYKQRCENQLWYTRMDDKYGEGRKRRGNIWRNYTDQQQIKEYDELQITKNRRNYTILITDVEGEDWVMW